MANVRVYIPISKGYHGESFLLETAYDMDFLPNEGDRVHVLRNDPESGLTFVVRSRWWDENGKAVLELPRQIIDPEDGGGQMPRLWQGWWSDRDGDLIEMLLANAWKHYNPKENK
jgi:hypothetical protein